VILKASLQCRIFQHPLYASIRAPIRSKERLTWLFYHHDSSYSTSRGIVSPAKSRCDNFLKWSKCWISKKMRCVDPSIRHRSPRACGCWNSLGIKYRARNDFPDYRRNSITWMLSTILILEGKFRREWATCNRRAIGAGNYSTSVDRGWMW